MITLLNNNEKPSWVIFPESYLKLVREDKDEFLPWYLIDREHLLVRLKGLKNRYPTRNLFPFARDDDSDDVACWEKEKPGKVIIIHDYASPGWENKLEFSSFDEWYNYVLSQKE